MGILRYDIAAGKLWVIESTVYLVVYALAMTWSKTIPLFKLAIISDISTKDNIDVLLLNWINNQTRFQNVLVKDLGA